MISNEANMAVSLKDWNLKTEDDFVTEPWLWRMWYAVKNTFLPRNRQRTHLEESLAADVAALQREIISLKAKNADLTTDVRQLQSTIKVQEVEITSLAAVIIRNQKRVEAETAMAASDIAKIAVGAPS